MHFILLQVPLDVICTWESRNKCMMESFPRTFWRDVLGGTLKIYNVWFTIAIQTLGGEGVQVVEEVLSLQGRDGVFVFEADNVDDWHVGRDDDDEWCG